MSLAKRVIPCLDVAAGRVVKGTRFLDLRDAGDPVAVARRYAEEGADEIAFLDIAASHEGRDTIAHTVEAVAEHVFIPLTVGGGVRTVENVRTLLRAGADKVGINTAAVRDPEFVRRAAGATGSQCIVVSIDARRTAEAQARWTIHTHGGRRDTGIDALQWAARMQECGAGELLLTSMDRDGTREGFDLALTRAVSDAVDIPVIASGGVGAPRHLVEGVAEGGADAVLAASIFHFRECSIREAKLHMREQGLEVRL